MLEVVKRKIVKPRKEHKCHFCAGVVPKGEQAVNVTCKEDARYVNLYLHLPCNKEARKIDLFNEGTLRADFSISSLKEKEFPF